MSINLMCDLETTGVDAGCCILSIALVPFASGTLIEPFYTTISHKSCKEAGFTDNEDTLAWWDKQKPDVQEEAFSGILSIKSVLEQVSAYCKTLGSPKDIYLWGNGKDFDNVILTAAFKKLGMQVPWHFKNNKCYRDLAAYYPMIKKEEVKQAHNAYHDAMAQARHASAIFMMIKRGLPPMLPGSI